MSNIQGKNERKNLMYNFETTPCIYYLADKNLEDSECLKLFTFYGEIFGASPEATKLFTEYLANVCCLYPRSFTTDEIIQMKARIIKPHAKRVNPYGCYDITRYGTFFNINVPKNICQGCPYSVYYKNDRKKSEKIIIAAILNKWPIPNKIKIQIELSGNKAVDAIMHSVCTVQGKEKNISKFDIIELNAFILKYLLSNYNLVTLENKDNIIRYVKKGFKTVLLKDRELNNTFDYVYEMLCKELLDICSIVIDNKKDEKEINDISEKLILPYKYNRNNAIGLARKVMTDNILNSNPAKSETESVPILIEPIEIPIIEKKVSIIGKEPVQNVEKQNKTPEKKERSEKTYDKEKIGKQNLYDPEQYYPVNYTVNKKSISENIIIIDDNSDFPFFCQVDDKYLIAVEKCLLDEDKGLLLYDDNSKYYFYRFCESENRPLRELMRRRPIMITMNSVELHAILREHRIYENRTADLKDMYISINAFDNLPHTFKSLFENMSGVSISECDDFYIYALKYYKKIYLSYLNKISDNKVLEIFNRNTAVSTAIGCSWYTNDIFEEISYLYERKSLFEYRSLISKEISTRIQGSFYCYWIDDVPAKKEIFYSGLIQELVERESIKLGKIIVLNISDKGLFLFAFETCGITYELLQWPCVRLARKLNIKNSHVHYHKQVCMLNDEATQPGSLMSIVPGKEYHKNVFQMDLK